jgi:hypothetical protein
LLFQAMVDRSRARLNMKCLKTIFGRKGRPHRDWRLWSRLLRMT